MEGTESLLEKPEFRHDVEALRRMFRAFEEKARLVNLLTDCLAGRGAAVVIGSESAFTDETQAAPSLRRRTASGDRVARRARGHRARAGWSTRASCRSWRSSARYVSRRLTEGAA